MVGIKVLVVGGDDHGYHDFTIIGKTFQSFLEKAGFNVTITWDCSCFLPEIVHKYDVLVCYINRIKIKKEEKQGLLDSIIGSHQGDTGKPKGFIGIHTAACSFPGSIAYQRMLGGRFLAHPKMEQELAIKVIKPEHPVMHGISDFKIVDELYLLEQFPPFEILLSCSYNGFEHPVAWVKPYGLGRVFYTSLGHGIEQLTNVNFTKMIINAVKWSVNNGNL